MMHDVLGDVVHGSDRRQECKCSKRQGQYSANVLYVAKVRNDKKTSGSVAPKPMFYTPPVARSAKASLALFIPHRTPVRYV